LRLETSTTADFVTLLWKRRFDLIIFSISLSSFGLDLEVKLKYLLDVLFKSSFLFFDSSLCREREGTEGNPGRLKAGPEFILKLEIGLF
jgi:hypothetical protein